MELSRRDAVAALAAAGVAVGGGAALSLTGGDDGDGDDDTPIDASTVATMAAAAAVVYPSAVENVDPFVEQYVRGRAGARPAHARGIVAATTYLDDYADAWHETSFAALDTATRDAVLRDMRVDAAAPDPEGSDVERVRYYVVNEVLFALYASPTGAELVGLENPQGHPGGIDSYQRGPEA